MKATFSLLFVIFIQACLNSSDDYVITIDDQNQLEVVGCEKGHYGFGFLAKTSGFGEGSSFSFYCDSPYYNNFECDIPASKEGEYQTISCWANAGIFPLLEVENKVTLPEEAPSISPLSIEGWQHLKKELKFEKCTQLEPTNTYTSNAPVTNACHNSSPFNVISTTGSFLSNLQGQKIFLTSTDEEYTTYRFKPYLIVDNKIDKATCDIYVPVASNGGDEELSCLVDGQKSGAFFETAAEFKLLEGTTQGVVRLKLTQTFNLQNCKSSSSSCFMKLSIFLLISLFLL